MLPKKLISRWYLALLVLAGENCMAIEEPVYEVFATYDKVEVRTYAPFMVAQATLPAQMAREDAASTAFRMLFRYIQGNNTSKTDISMTAPVLQEHSTKIAMTAPVSQSVDEAGWQVSFVLPAQFTMNNAPQPKDPDIRLVQMPSRHMAVLRYSGRWSEKNFQKYQQQLTQVLAEHGLQTAGKFVSAAYNAPFVPPFMRRNEVLVEVVGLGSE